MTSAELPAGTVTFLLTDIEGSTRLLQRLGEDYRAVLETHAGLIRAALVEWHGLEVSTEGDSFFTVFSSAADGVACATGIQRALADHTWPGETRLRVRIGLHTGEADRSGDGYVGMDVHRAALIAGAAHGGQVILSAAAAGLVEHVLPRETRLRDLGSHELGELKHPEHLYQLVVEDLQTEFPPLRTRTAPKTNLPHRVTTFIDRVVETEAVSKAVRRGRLVTLTGAGGVGKTSLAIHAAEQLAHVFTDGVWLVEMARVTDETRIASAVAQALEIMELSTESTEETVSSRLANATALLILDGCEHLVDGIARFVDGFMQTTAAVHVLATSREALSIGGETILSIDSLAAPPPRASSVVDVATYDAVELFVDRAQQVRPDFTLSDEAVAAVVEICRRLDGLPLAIELAAARMKILSVQQLAERLDSQFAVLTGGGRDALPHQQTLEATLDWSYRLLSEHEQLLFRRLSVFSGGFTLEGAEEVCGDDPLKPSAILDLLARLVDTSLVVSLGVGQGRYRMLGPIGRYAAMKLGEDDDPDGLHRRHATYFLSLAEQADEELLRPDQLVWSSRLEQDHDNLISALEWALQSGDQETALRLAGAIRWYWVMLRRVAEGTEWLEKVLSARAGGSLAATARALNGAGLMATRRLDFRRARQALEESLQAYRELGDAAGVARQTYHLATLAWFEDDNQAADALAAEAIEIGEGEDPWSVGWALAVRGTLARSNVDFDRADGLLTDSHTIFSRMGGPFDLGWSYLRLGALARDRGQYDRATDNYELGRKLLDKAGDAVGRAHADAGQGAIAWLKGDHEDALALYESALETYRDADRIADNIFELRTMVIGKVTTGELQRIVQWNRERSDLDEAGKKAALAEHIYNLGKVAFRAGELDRAEVTFGESLDLAHSAGDGRGTIIALIALGRCAQAVGDEERAASSFAGAARLARAEALQPWPPTDEPDFEEHVAALRASMPVEAFDGTWGAAESMSVEVLLERAREPSRPAGSQ